MLPFSPEQFLQVFGAFNAAIWPIQFLVYGLGLLVVASVFRSGPTADRIVCTSLAIMWLFTGTVYHWFHFASINPVAGFFGGGFVLQAGILAFGGFSGRIRFSFVPGVRASIGSGLILYSTLFYPLIGLLFHGYPDVPLFGVTPCPLTIFTLGCLVMTREPAPWWTLVIPLLWSLIGGSAAFLLGVLQDWVLLATGVVVAGIEMRARTGRIMRPRGVPGRSHETCTLARTKVRNPHDARNGMGMTR